ncbi:MAG: hypothetical protein H7Y20_05310 [Bryobacteraceae bacterium]|nr:hypothetical protein [Bryobacteraceae bacterium]
MNPPGNQRNENSSSNDQQAIERYRYMLRTAPPETIQQAHEEAFARLTAEQRQIVLRELTASAPPEESRQATDEPASLARLATRTEVRQPGMLERVFGSSRMSGGSGGGMGIGGMLGGTFLASIAGTFIGSSIAHSFFEQNPLESENAQGMNEIASSDDTLASSGNTTDAGADDFGDLGGDLDI